MKRLLNITLILSALLMPTLGLAPAARADIRQASLSAVGTVANIDFAAANRRGAAFIPIG